MAAPVKLSAVNSTLLPDTVTGPIFEKTIESSAVMQQARKIPLPIDASTAIPIPGDVPLADWVDEGAKKPVSEGSVGVKTMSGKKVAVLVPASEELARTNAGGLYEQLQSDLPKALARAFDFAAIHGKSLKTGAAGPFADFLAATAKSVTLGTATQANGGVYGDIVAGEGLVVDDDWDFSGFVADPRLRVQLAQSYDTTGRPLFSPYGSLNGGPQVNNAVGNGGYIAGYPANFSPGVSGRLRRQSTSSDSGLRAIGGDWTQAIYGVGMGISMRVSTEGGYIDDGGTPHFATQENLVILVCEAYFGFAMGDASAFVKYLEAGIS